MSKLKIIWLIILKYKEIKKYENCFCLGIVFWNWEKKLGFISLYIYGIWIDLFIFLFWLFIFSKYNWYGNWYKVF